MLFKVVVDMVDIHWMTIFGIVGCGTSGILKDGTEDGILFYTNEGLIESTQPEWLQETFNTLIGVFYRVGLSTNVVKMVRIILHSCRVVGTHSDMAYKRTIVGEGLTYWAH